MQRTGPASRLVEIWNNLPGVTPAETVAPEPEPEAAQIEEPAASEDAIPTAQPEMIAAAEPEMIAEVVIETPAESSEAPATATPEPADVPAPVSAQAPDVAPEASTPNPEATPPKKATREGSKTAQVIAMLKREGGTTIEEIMTAMGWQKHTTRAMLSAGGALTKNHGLVITSEKVGDHRRYSIKN